MGSATDDCILCPDVNKWLHLVDGKCYADCPVNYFGNTLINKCRPCEATCKTCNGIFNNNCLSCGGSLYLNFLSNTCISNCVAANLTHSISQANMCALCNLAFNLLNLLS